MLILETRIGRPLEVWLREQYVDAGRTQEEIAAELGVNNSAISKWLRLFGIPTRLFGPRKRAAA